ncbi:sulfatase-like hydrolase/transferase [Undibacterium sp. CY7W]|uniref:Sulfatase-like hydrolase/transferase n=2 Tax=Undibacterium rugosum TaxID=2762291 RepID=A0A923L0C3_9BURK|nr:sulfatase-like hydrolase/transferase [Undibacterium rugosum]MBR7776945.1 sulfatase-like hydrolase/transferase [Undibacterium rugosum]
MAPISRRQFLGSSALAASMLSGLVQAKPQQARPNILFIMADDLGWADLGCYGMRDFATPVLDQLASEGVRLTHAYANSPVCSASRTAIITGRYQYRLRVGLEEPIPDAKSMHGLSPAHPTLPSLLGKSGYRTALLGKWHLGAAPEFGPLKSGYQYFFGNMQGGIDYFTHKAGVGANEPVDLWEGEQLVHEHGYYTDILSQHAEQYVRAQANEAAPFLLSLHYTAPHWPWEGPMDEAVAGTLKKLIHGDGGSLETYGKMVTAMDSGIGKVLQALKETGQADNTIVIFTSDNGGERFSHTWPLSGQKTKLLEGGIRVPAIIRWPAALKPAVSDQICIGMDWLPTLLAAAGVAPDPAFPSDGVNLLPVLKQQEKAIPRTLYWRYKSFQQRAVIDNYLKYLKIGNNEFLFDLRQDPRERANLAAHYPAQFQRLKQQWQQWDATMLPITKEVYSHRVPGQRQADHYAVGLDD